jgi:isopenicillin N synthase-like dioxygenase
MFGDKERYSFALFSLPKKDVEIEVPQELVEDKMHPLHYRSFNYDDYLDYFMLGLKENKGNTLEAFIGV